jgi:hypothetical protein
MKRGRKMKKNHPYMPIAIMITVIVICAFILGVSANIWLFTDFRTMDNRNWFDIVKAVGVVMIDICVAVYCICNAKEIASDYDDEDE